MRVAALAVLAAACSSPTGHQPARASAAPPDAPIADAVQVAPTDAGELAVTAPAPPHEQRRKLSLMLMSTPPGADVAVDHQYVGKTPVYWEGPFTGATRTFTFWMPGYKAAEYTFIPTTDGFVHPTLVPGGEDDGGVPPAP